jgi:hypothetical protein
MRNIIVFSVFLCLAVSGLCQNPGGKASAVPTRALPDPLPPITTAANTSQIAAFTGGEVSPWGGVFDSSGRYIFFDQKVWISETETKGTNRLIRMTTSGASPSFETIATQAQLGALDPRWIDPDYWPELINIDLLSDGSIVMIGFGDNDQKLLRIIPGNPPQISVIANIYVDLISSFESVQIFAVDRNQNPNKIYLLVGGDVYTVNANQTNATPSMWLDTSHDLNFIWDMAIDDTGNLIYCESYFDGGNIKMIDKNTKAISTISQQTFGDSLEGNYSFTIAFDIDQTTGNIFGQYYGSYPDSGTYHLFKATKNMSGLYEAIDFATERQVLEDADISPWVDLMERFINDGAGLDVYPGGNYFFFTSGSHNYTMVYVPLQGIDSIVKIGTVARTGARSGLWCHYE